MSEITYDLILKHLYYNNNNKIMEENLEFPLEESKTMSFKTYPKEFKFLKNSYRLGINCFFKIKYKNKSDRVLNWSNLGSIYSIVSQDFDTFVYDNNITKHNKLTLLKQKMLNEISKDKSSSVLKTFGWTKKNFQEVMLDMSGEVNDKIVLTYAAYYFNVNVFIFDFKKRKISCTYTTPKFSKYKKYVCIAKYEDNYEPIFINKDTDFLDNILKNDIKIYNSYFSSNNNVKFEVGETLDDIINLVTKKSDDSIMTKANLSKKKKDELLEILNTLGIESKKYSKTKKDDIIDLIIKSA